MSCGCSEVHAAEPKSIVNPLVTAVQIATVTFHSGLLFFWCGINSKISGEMCSS